MKRITVNLASADLKEGPLFDLPIAIGILTATGQIPNNERIKISAMVGELSLDGKVRPVPGVLAMSDRISRLEEVRYFLVPEENAGEAALIKGTTVYPVGYLRDLVRFFIMSMILCLLRLMWNSCSKKPTERVLDV